jgi:hypothetical protein
MSLRRAAALAIAPLAVALSAAACGEDDRPLPAVCASGPEVAVRALRAAPAPVRIDGETKLSSCVERARSDADIQTVGSVLTRTADSLAGSMDRSDEAALELGYLIAAVRKGARHTNGIHRELVRRVEQTIGLEGAPPPRRAAFDRGLAAGERTG